MRSAIGPRHMGHLPLTLSAQATQQVMCWHGKKTTRGSAVMHTQHSRVAEVTTASPAVAATRALWHLKQAWRVAKLFSPQPSHVQSPGLTVCAAAPCRVVPHLRQLSLWPKILKLHLGQYQSAHIFTHPPISYNPAQQENDSALVRFVIKSGQVSLAP